MFKTIATIFASRSQTQAYGGSKTGTNVVTLRKKNVKLSIVKVRIKKSVKNVIVSNNYFCIKY